MKIGVMYKMIMIIYMKNKKSKMNMEKKVVVQMFQYIIMKNIKKQKAKNLKFKNLKFIKEEKFQEQIFSKHQ